MRVALAFFLNLIFYTFKEAATLNYESPCVDETWFYEPSSGKCYQIVGGSRLANLTEAQQICQKLLPSFRDVKVILPELYSDEDLEGLKQALVKNSTKESVWLNAKRQSSTQFAWQSNNKPVDLSFTTWSVGAGTGDCLMLYYISERTGNSWVTRASIEETSCKELNAIVCVHEVPDCTKRPAFFDENTMEFTPTPPHPGTLTSVACKSGYHPKILDSSLTTANKYKCIGTRDKSKDPSKYKPDLQQILEVQFKCEAISCDLEPKALCNVQPETLDQKDKLVFKYGETVSVQCVRGYVASNDASTRKATTQCLSFSTDPTLGVWVPGLCSVCSAVRCNETEMKAMIPRYAKLTRARNRFTGTEYGPLEQNQFARHGNVVTYSCQESYFYPDRTLEKEVECTLADDEGLVGKWVGYSGTLLPLPTTCEPVTCKYEAASVSPQHNIEVNFTVKYANGSSELLTKLQPVPYPYLTTIRYFCVEGFETVLKMPDQNITCGPAGDWTPHLAGCIKTVENVNTSSSGRYEPPPIEAPSAKQLGAVVIGIIVIFLVCLLLLDLATLRRDISWLFNNIRLQKRLFLAKRRLHRAKKEAKMKQ